MHPLILSHPGHVDSLCLVFKHSSDGKASVYNAGDLGLIPGSGRSPREGNGNPLQYYCLEIPWTEEPGRLQVDTIEQLHFTSVHLFSSTQ